ncbi:MAG: hypothetical protein KC519_14515, partial [Anaerolineae bacterium]|nr:hypothetical protein [Anaerolineae bacterium]
MRKKSLLKRAAEFGLLCCFLIVQANLVSAQETPRIEQTLQLESPLRFEHLNSDNGLAQNNIEAILQDRNGFMWFGTQSGLSRYNGYDFTTYLHDPEDPNSLSHNHINDLFQDRDGVIWIATEGGGINTFDPETETFTSYASTPETPSAIVGDRHSAIFQDSRGRMWFGGTRAFGLTEFDPVTHEAATYFPGDERADGLQGNDISDVVETADQQLWIATGFVIARHQLGTQAFKNYDLSNFGERRLITLHHAASGDLWAGGEHGLYRLNTVSDSFEQYPIPAQINSILETSDGLFWLATDRGLYRFDPQTGTIVSAARPNPGIADSLRSARLLSLFQSNSGHIWIGGENGIDIYDPWLDRFDYYRHSIPGAPASLIAGRIQGIDVVGDTTAWIGVNSVLHKADLGTGEIALYDLRDKLGAQIISAILQDHAGIVWLGGNLGRLLSFD